MKGSGPGPLSFGVICTFEPMGHSRNLLNHSCSFSLHLSGNKADPPKNVNGKTSLHHTRVYTAEEIQRHPDVRLTRGGLVLFALMSGGDCDDVRSPSRDHLWLLAARLKPSSRFLPSPCRASSDAGRTWPTRWHACGSATTESSRRTSSTAARGPASFSGSSSGAVPCKQPSAQIRRASCPAPPPASSFPPNGQSSRPSGSTPAR